MRTTARAAACCALAGLACACVAAHAQSAGASIAINLTVVSKSNCRFTTLPAAALPFGTLDPSATVAGTVSIGAAFKCGGTAKDATFAVSASKGLHFDGLTRRMQHANGVDYLPYTVTLSPATATAPKNTVVPLTITGTVAVASFRDAIQGDYSDTISISVTP